MICNDFQLDIPKSLTVNGRIWRAALDSETASGAERLVALLRGLRDVPDGLGGFRCDGMYEWSCHIRFIDETEGGLKKSLYLAESALGGFCFERGWIILDNFLIIASRTIWEPLFLVAAPKLV